VYEMGKLKSTGNEYIVEDREYDPTVPLGHRRVKGNN